MYAKEKRSPTCTLQQGKTFFLTDGNMPIHKRKYQKYWILVCNTLDVSNYWFFKEITIVGLQFGKGVLTNTFKK